MNQAQRKAVLALLAAMFLTGSVVAAGAPKETGPKKPNPAWDPQRKPIGTRKQSLDRALLNPVVKEEHFRHCRSDTGLPLVALVPLTTRDSIEVRSREQSRLGAQLGPLRPVALKDVRLLDGLWAQRQKVIADAALPYAFEKAQGLFENFAKAAGVMPGTMVGQPWDDAIPYCLLNAAANSLVWHPHAQREKMLERYIDWIRQAMEPDGYIYTARKLLPLSKLQGHWASERWVNMRMSHEEFNSAHLIDAACAHYEATGRTDFLTLARRNADLWSGTFGPSKRNDLTGHEAIKMALVRLYRDTGEKRYLQLAEYLLDHRADPRPDANAYPNEYFQCHLPVRQQREAVGHQVRGYYLYAAMADILLETGDPRLLSALEAIWTDLTGRKLYLTGGAAPAPHESFGSAYHLPNGSAYCESCAAVASVFFQHRMNLVTRDAKYVDVMERALLNNVLGGIALDGRGFFYVNRLSAGKNAMKNGRGWPALACCPPNILRLLTSVNAYLYATAPGCLWVNLYAASEARISWDRQTVRVKQATQYPWEGRVRIEIAPETPLQLAIHLRIPTWANESPLEGQLYRYLDPKPLPWRVSVNGQPITPALEKGYAVIDRTWRAGDWVELELPMPVRRVIADPQVEANRNRVALERGPLVYCAEGTDNPGPPERLVLDRPCPWSTEFRKDLLGGITVLQGEARRVGATECKEPLRLTLIPYYARANRGPDDTAVWLPAQAR